MKIHVNMTFIFLVYALLLSSMQFESVMSQQMDKNGQLTTLDTSEIRLLNSRVSVRSISNSCD